MSTANVNAVLCRKYCMPEDLKLESYTIEEPGDGQVLVQVVAAGVNFPDVLMIQGKYQSKPPFPFAPGGEISGIVKKVGPGVESVKIGDHVLGMVGHGGFSEAILVSEFQLVKLPKSFDLITGAGFMMTYGTSYHALKQRAQLKAGETILVLGAAGGVGLATVDIAKSMGATVIAAASTDEKLQVCKDFGADHLINYSNQDLKKEIKKITGGNGVDVVYDPIGDKYAEPCVRSLAWKGRYLVIGFAAGEIPKIPLNLTLLKGCQIVGVFWGSFTFREPEVHMQNTKELIELILKKKLNPLVTQTYPLKDAPKALRDMMNRKVKGKAVILCSATPQEASL